MPNTPSINPVVPLLPGFLRALALVAKDPALGYRGAAVNSALNFTATAIERGVEAQAAFKELADYVKVLADTGKEPDKAAWFDFKARHDAAEMLFNPPPPEVSPGGEPTPDPEDEEQK